MAISLTYSDIKNRYSSKHYASFKEFEDHYIKWIREIKGDTLYYTGKNGKEIKIKPIDHHPKLKEYEVWEEGFVIQGQSGKAILLGKAKARNFAQACHIVVCRRLLEWMDKINDPDYTEYAEPGRWDYDSKKLASWGCSLYWSEKLAKQTFG